MKVNAKALTVNSGRVVEKADVELTVYEWIMNLRQDDIAVSSSQVIAKALAEDPNFHGGDTKKLWYWVYKFYKKSNLSIRAVTHQGQKLNAHIQEIRKEFALHLQQRFGQTGSCNMIGQDFICNMDQTAVFFECKPSKTVNRKGDKTIAVRNSGSNSHRMTVCLSVTASGQKLDPFVIFKVVPGGRIEKSFPIFCRAALKVVVRKTDGWMNRMRLYGLPKYGSLMQNT